MVNNDIIEP